jgi:hypothetical protein
LPRKNLRAWKKYVFSNFFMTHAHAPRHENDLRRSSRLRPSQPTPANQHQSAPGKRKRTGKKKGELKNEPKPKPLKQKQGASEDKGGQEVIDLTVSEIMEDMVSPQVVHHASNLTKMHNSKCFRAEPSLQISKAPWRYVSASSNTRLSTFFLYRKLSP